MRSYQLCKECAHIFQENHNFLTVICAKKSQTFTRNFSSYIRSKYESSKQFPASYVPADVEAGVYDWWQKEGYLNTSTPEAEPFSIVLPPPNVTGTLHLGHALTATIQDVLARWHRMQGRSVSWVPGTDHAGIATQVVVEKKLWQERQLTRHDIGRDEFVEEVWKWKNEKGGIITQQLRKLGSSLDWSREAFTMDPNQSAATTEAFIRLHDAGLIYRANSLVNWSCILRSAISDIEVDYKEITGPTFMAVPGYEEPVEFGVLTRFAYSVHNQDEEIVVSTTRIETMVGDVAVAVHPDDARYKQLHGAELWHPFRQKTIPIICDEMVDPTFGTGAVKITPAHNHIDFEVGKKHGLDVVSVVTEDGTLNENCGTFAKMKRFDARKSIAAELDNMGLLRGKSPHAMMVPVCSRSRDVIEFLLKPQWFIDCKSMAKQAVTAVQNGDLCIEPASFEKIWFNWLNNIRDWCVSRQLWWGHRVPLYHCHDKHSASRSIWVAAKSQSDACRKAASILGLTEEQVAASQDEDVLDTWFTSALFPFSSLGWPDQTADFKRLYPLSMMETGHDILFFWVARMVMLGTFLTGQLPFKKILLHGIICDSHGRKMSKSLGNVVYPEDIIHGISLQALEDKAQGSFKAGLISKTELQMVLTGQKKLFPDGIPMCGTDALRFTLCSQNITNFFINLDINTCHTNRLFCNKIWQACKYILLCSERVHLTEKSTPDKLSNVDRWILSRLAFMVMEVNRGLQKSEFHVATAALKTFLYSEFCDIYLELTKPVVKSPTASAAAAFRTLVQCADTTLRALSPFMPYITEELYQQLPQVEGIPRSESIMVASYPVQDEVHSYRNETLESEVDRVMAVVSVIRRLKSDYNIKIKKPEVHVVSTSPEECQVYRQYTEAIATLTNCGSIIISGKESEHLQDACVRDTVGQSCSVHIAVKGKDAIKEQTELSRKHDALTKQMEKLLRVTGAPGYKTGAPAQVQEAHQKKIQTLEFELKKLCQMRSLNSAKA